MTYQAIDVYRLRFALVRALVPSSLFLLCDSPWLLPPKDASRLPSRADALVGPAYGCCLSRMCTSMISGRMWGCWSEGGPSSANVPPLTGILWRGLLPSLAYLGRTKASRSFSLLGALHVVNHVLSNFHLRSFDTMLFRLLFYRIDL